LCNFSYLPKTTHKNWADKKQKMTQRIQHHEQSDPPNKANPLKSKKKRGHLEPACEEDPRRLRKSGAFDRRGQLDAPPLTRKGNP
jgi:hypothetical protein